MGMIKLLAAPVRSIVRFPLFQLAHLNGPPTLGPALCGTNVLDGPRVTRSDTHFVLI
jgi:hypothetical protein